MPNQALKIIGQHPDDVEVGSDPRDIGKTNQLNRRQIESLRKQQYRIVGKHSGIKVCKYCKDDLRGKGSCYKNKFYGIASGQCIQMSPTMQFCTENCGFCWRTLRYHNKVADDWDPPEAIVEGCIQAHKQMLMGFAGNGNTGEAKFGKAMQPRHFAISLSGEPTLYPYLPEMIECIKRKGMTAFLVTNGTNPGMVRRLLEKRFQPTQIYMTLAGPDWPTLKRATNPILEDTWERVMETLGLLGKFERSVVRLTLARGVNMANPECYGELAEKSGASFLEAKGYVAVGGSAQRLGFNYMPRHGEILEFAQKIAGSCSYKIRDVMEQSRCVLLAREGTSQPDYSKEFVVEV